MEAVRVLVAEDDPLQREKLVETLGQSVNLLVVGAAANGVEALRLIRERSPQVLVCDMVMPKLDGFGVLEQVARMETGRKPKIIALTALSRGDFITRAMELGASYYLVKPVDASFLIKQILKLAGWPMPGEAPARALRQDESSEQAAAGILLNIGVPAHLNGYRFLLRSVLMVLEDPDCLNHITQGLYPAVAQHYNTTASRVERSIRHAIDSTWARGGARAFAPVLPGRALSPEDKPSNCEMIALLSEQVRLHRLL